MQLQHSQVINCTVYNHTLIFTKLVTYSAAVVKSSLDKFGGKINPFILPLGTAVYFSSLHCVCTVLKYLTFTTAHILPTTAQTVSQLHTLR